MTSPPATSKSLNVGLWIVQAALALMFIRAGAWKSFTPISELAVALPWVAKAPAALIRFIGVSELLGGIGMLLPAATRIRPRLTGWAGVGLAVVMLLAAAFHLYRGELGMLPVVGALGAAAAFVAWGRLSGAPIRPR